MEINRTTRISIDKLLMTCIVKIDKLQLFHCDICDAIYCKEESLFEHLNTHVKQEDATECNKSSTYETHKSKNNQKNADASCNREFENGTTETRERYVPIRDRIIYESDSEDSLISALDASMIKNEEWSDSDSDFIINNHNTIPKNSKEKIPAQAPVSLENKGKSNVKIYSCSICIKGFDQRRSLVRHELNHSRNSPMCDICGKKFEYYGHLRVHRLLHNENLRYCCDICKKGFRTEVNLRKHETTHTLQRCLKCKFCEKMFKSPGQLKSHLRMHNDERPFFCVMCNQNFRYQSALAYHSAKIHKIGENATCAICNKQFVLKLALENHIYSKHLTTGYPCRKCNKEYGHPFLLAKHMRLHNKNNPLMCSFCNKCFTSTYYKNRHEKCAHMKLFDYECQNCNRKFGRKDHLVRHIKKSCHQEPYRCSKCKLVCRSVLALCRHINKCGKKR